MPPSRPTLSSPIPSTLPPIKPRLPEPRSQPHLPSACSPCPELKRSLQELDRQRVPHVILPGMWRPHATCVAHCKKGERKKEGTLQERRKKKGRDRVYIDKFCNYKQPRIHVAAMTTLVVWFPVQNIRTSNHHDNRSCGSRILLITIAELWHCEVLRYMAPCTEYQPTIHPTHCRAVLMAVRL